MQFTFKQSQFLREHERLIEKGLGDRLVDDNPETLNEFMATAEYVELFGDNDIEDVWAEWDYWNS